MTHEESIGKQGKKVVKQEYIIDNSDINKKGQYLGYDWNTICDWLACSELYGEDGAGYTFIERGETFKPTELQHIIDEIFKEVPPHIDSIRVIDDF